MLNKIRFFLPALLCAAAAHALVTPNPASLLSTKKILVIRGTDAVSSEHGGARVALNAKLRQLQAQVGFQIDSANATTSGTGYASAASGVTLGALADYDIIFFNYWFHSANAGTLTTFQGNFKAWSNNTAKKRGWLGVHTSGANEANEWNWFRDSVTAMQYHVHAGGAQAGTIRKTTVDSIRNAPIMAGLPDTVRIPSDEWYDFAYAPLFADARVMYYLDESTLPTPLPAEARMNPHPSTWYREASNGNRYFYTALVHNASGVNLTQGNDYFTSMMLRALEYLAGYQPAASIRLNGNGMYHNNDKVKGLRFIRDGRLHVESETPFRVELRSMQGRLLFSAPGRGRASYDPPALKQPGMYVVKVASKKGSYSQRVMVQ
jgi:type 1 glutamine amidotransferase